MIKICSLDFLNKETFETDIMSADGGVVIKADSEVTPELLLKLYFKNIYVNEPLKEETEIVSSEELEVSSAPSTLSAEEEETENSEQETEETETADENEEVNLSTIQPLDNLTEEEAEGTENSEPETEETETKIEISAKNEEVKPSTIQTFDHSTEEKTKDSAKGPRIVDASLEEEDDDKKKGPRMAKPLFGQEELKKEEKPVEAKLETLKIEPVEENPEEKQLEFDEEQAKKIVDSSLKIGKIIGFSANELKDLEQVAYYSNIGISKFKVKDLKRKEFNKMRIYASYEKLMEDGTVSSDVAEMIKYCANNYESNAFPFNSKIPYYHIVAITSYYETSLLQTNSKQETLLKMLQLGGNQFNIFILHKFINMMREANG